ncbi:putative bifunctional diguanylate cyclase/phosphodiesterase [Xanthobacter sp. TB0139]|uniref:putative bifunctional diguanylate cyclase/phosphodiesterase n=1 Tax=Xanthobacter sp. TB0139 TaxID=3459178 RepID=UPI004039ED67
MLTLQNRVLGLIANNAPLPDVLERLCLEVERLVENADCSVLLVDPAGMLHPVVAPSFPEIYLRSLDGILVGPGVGSSGSAVYYNIPVTVEDIEDDPKWGAFKAMALPLGWRACIAEPLRNGDGRAIGALAIYLHAMRALSEKERQVLSTAIELCELALSRHEPELEREYHFLCDPLTGLPNKPACDEALLKLRCEKPGSWGMLIISIDDLKNVNDALGFEAGNAMIIEIARRLSAVLAPDYVYRTAGNEFTVILQDQAALRDLDQAAAQVFAVLSSAFFFGEKALHPQVTMGSALLSMQDRRAESVRNNADFALYHAKATRRGSHVKYGPEIGSRFANRRVSVQEVIEALEDNRVDAQYQPILRLDTYEIIGFEALCRLTNHQGEILPAAIFREAFSDARVAVETTRHMLEIVARDIRTWQVEGLPVQFIGVNITSADFSSGDLPSKIDDAFTRHGAALKHLVLEVTEDADIGQRDQVVSTGIMELKIKDVRVAFDDFGVGRASLGHLLTVPVDIIKIDREFIRKLGEGPSLPIVRGVLQIASDLGIVTVAEGIETVEQAEMLRGLGCEFGQGYAFSRAVAREQAVQLLRKHGHGLEKAMPLMPHSVS